MVQDATALPQSASLSTPVPAAELNPGNELASRLKQGAVSLGYFLASMAILIGLWWLVCATFAKNLPTPLVTAHALGNMVAKPYYVNSDGTMGVINLIIASLARVFVGFGIGSIIAIPLGILMGASKVSKRLIDPIAQIMKPVSPLAWFPLSQVIFQSLGDKATPAAIVGTIAITSLWPTLINTAFGVASLPEDYRTVARVFQFSTRRYLSKVLIPYSLPHILTGLRLSMGIAWLVIVAAEMLSGQSGVGFSAYEAYNQGRLDEMMSTIIIIGLVGLVLDRGLDFIARKLSYENGK